MPEFELASREFIDEFGIYLLDNGCVIYIFVGVQADPNQGRTVSIRFGTCDLTSSWQYWNCSASKTSSCSIPTNLSSTRTMTLAVWVRIDCLLPFEHCSDVNVSQLPGRQT